MDEIQPGNLFERIRFGFDLVQLRNDLERISELHPPVMPTPWFGGWSLQSRDGSMTDGWVQGHTAFVEKDKNFEFDREHAETKGITPWTSDYRIRTSLCDGYFGHVLSEIETFGLNPRRARIALMKPGCSMEKHVDGPSDGYSVRLHIPILTNPQCAIEYSDQNIHMVADGSGYLVRVNRLHRAFNLGTTDRYHLLMDVFDFQGATKFHHFDSTKERLVGWRA